MRVGEDAAICAVDEDGLSGAVTLHRDIAGIAGAGRSRRQDSAIGDLNLRSPDVDVSGIATEVVRAGENAGWSGPIDLVSSKVLADQQAFLSRHRDVSASSDDLLGLTLDLSS